MSQVSRSLRGITHNVVAESGAQQPGAIVDTSWAPFAAAASIIRLPLVQLPTRSICIRRQPPKVKESSFDTNVQIAPRKIDRPCHGYLIACAVWLRSKAIFHSTSMASSSVGNGKKLGWRNAWMPWMRTEFLNRSMWLRRTRASASVSNTITESSDTVLSLPWSEVSSRAG